VAADPIAAGDRQPPGGLTDDIPRFATEEGDGAGARARRRRADRRLRAVALDPAPQAARPSSEPTVQVIRASAPGGFDWGDAGIGAAGGVGIAMLGVGGALVIAGVRRNDPGPVQPRWSRPDRGLS
jgi:hypothetical protein